METILIEEHTTNPSHRMPSIFPSDVPVSKELRGDISQFEGLLSILWLRDAIFADVWVPTVAMVSISDRPFFENYDTL